ncbi:uncharacterized protein [Apostichopus japonicus]|uniref:uncharacterized protein isoform X2 n=1 Tax=Stichopus japonicus TaxID=307972 RepID=UPI003AB34BE1
MAPNKLLEKFPVFWKPIVKALMAPKSNSKLVEEVLLRNLCKDAPGRSSASSRCEIPDWHSLLKNLCEAEPTLTESGICMNPRFVLMSFHAQHCMFKFLEKHKAELPLTMLQTFLKSTQDKLIDDWCKLYHQLLHIHNLNMCSKVQHTINKGFLSQKSTTYFESLCDQIKSEDSNRNLPSSQPQCHWLSEVSAHDKGQSDRSIPCIATDSQISQRRKRKVSVEGERQSVSSSAKRQKLEPSAQDIFPDVENDMSRETESEASMKDELPASQELSSQGDIWKDRLKSTFSPLQEIFQSSKPSMTPAHIDLFKQLMTMLLVEISELKQTIPRNLLVTLIQFANAYPKPLLEGCLIPYMQRGMLGPHQADCMLKISKECLDNQSKILFLRALLQSHHLDWNEHVSGFVQGIINLKVEVDSETVNIIITILCAAGETQRKCPKFSKLFLAIVNKFKAKLTSDQKSLLLAAVERNETFLKKAIISALKKSMGKK